MHTSRLAQLAIAVATRLGRPVRRHAAAREARRDAVGFLVPAVPARRLLALLALLLGLVALFTTRRAEGPRRPRARVGRCALAVAVIGAVSRSRRARRRACRRSTTSPPTRRSAAVRRARARGPNAGRDMSYPGEAFASQQRAGYPDLAPIDVAARPTDVRGREGGDRELRLADRRGRPGGRHDRGHRHVADLPLRRRHRRSVRAAPTARASTCARSRAWAGRPRRERRADPAPARRARRSHRSASAPTRSAASFAQR